MFFGGEKVVVLAGYKTVKNALVNHDEEFGERAIPAIIQELNKGLGNNNKNKSFSANFYSYIFRIVRPSVIHLCFVLGVLWSNGDIWRDIRRFALTNLRDFGMGKKACEDKITEECQYLLEVFKKFRGTILFSL